MGLVIGMMVLVAVGIVVVVMNVAMRKRGYAIPGRTLVVCSQGHHFRTLWIEGGSFKAIRLGPRKRIQRCPVCKKFRVIVALPESQLSDAIQEEVTRNTPPT